MKGLGTPFHSPAAPSGYTYMRMVESETHNKRTSSVPSTKRTLSSSLLVPAGIQDGVLS